jgi:hypothetical protein
MEDFPLSIPARVRRAILGISPSEATFVRRGFAGGEPVPQSRLEEIGRTFIAGYHAALESDDVDCLGDRLLPVNSEWRGFAFEGAAMALTLLDHLIPGRRRFQRFLAGPGADHPYMLHVGAGWACARLPWLRLRMEASTASMDPILRWLAIDGFGFHEGYFAWPRVGVRQQVPRGVRGYVLRAFDQGLGRSIWFVSCACAQPASRIVEQFDRSRRADLWSGLGLASAYAGCCAEWVFSELAAAAEGYRAELAQGAAFAAKARLRAGNLAPHTEQACAAFCGISAREAAAITDSAFENLPKDGPQPAFEIWRRRIQEEFAAVRR